MMLLRDRYLGACDRVITKTGTAGEPYRIPEDATLKRCAGYLKRYIVGERDHFRYGYYMRMLDYGFGRDLDVERGGSKRLIIHVDLGTGPGIFNWVVYDYVQQNWERKNRPGLKQFGYDRCPAMVKLAKRIQKDLGTRNKVQYTDSRKALRKSVGAVTGDAYLLITFGYVLIQSNEGDRRAISSLAKTCNRLAMGRDAVDVLAVDAYADDRRRHQFDDAAKRLHRKLRRTSVGAATNPPWKRGRIPPDVLRNRSRAIMSIRGAQ